MLSKLDFRHQSGSFAASALKATAFLKVTSNAELKYLQHIFTCLRLRGFGDFLCMFNMHSRFEMTPPRAMYIFIA